MSYFIDPPRKLFYHLDRISSIQHGGQPAPVNVEIDLSNRCSLHCEGCHFAYTHSKGPWYGKSGPAHGIVPTGDLMETILAVDMLKQLTNCGVRSVT
jgi:hypothetical protein